MEIFGNISSECLHRAADLTLVPSAAIAKDLVEAKVTTGEKFNDIDLMEYSLNRSRKVYAVIR